MEIIKRIGRNIEVVNHKIRIETPELKNIFIHSEIANKMRRSILLLGILLPRFPKIKIPFPVVVYLAKRDQ